MKKLGKVLYITLLDFLMLLASIFIGSLIICLYHMSSGSDAKNVPLTFYSIWVLAFFAIPLYLLRKKNIEILKIMNMLAAFYLIAGISGGIITGITSIFPKFETVSIFNTRFVGLSGNEEVNVLDSNGDDVIQTSHNKSFVFSKDDARIDDESTNLEEKFEDGMDKEKFIFWQTALASGYNPAYIETYTCCSSYEDKLVLYGTVGPTVIFETFLKAINRTAIFFFVPILIRRKYKNSFYTNFETFKKFFRSLFLD
ncbi:hypothetical protein QEG73_14910 [Chitinophagaceae bacterium 26-R-25]|nr:hypothetical protein [Chitinophagaceae bacterium 26-R-25]